MADFATVAELETYMGSVALGGRGTAMLTYASAQIRLYCAQDLDAVAGRQESYAGRWDQDVITLTQRPVTAVSAITVDAVAFTDFTWTRFGEVYKDDGSAWDTGPILITYDSGYASDSDEMTGIKSVCLEMAARALGGSPETFGLEAQEVRGPTPAVYLTEEEKMELTQFMGIGVG